MKTADLALVLLEKALDWPFLFFILILLAVWRFRKEISERIKGITEVEVSKGKVIQGDSGGGTRFAWQSPQVVG